MKSIAAKYQIRLNNYDGDTIAIFDNFSSLSFNKKVNDIGSFSLSLYDNADARFDYLLVDTQVEFWRTIPGCSLNWYLEYEGFIRRRKRSVESDGQRVIEVSGYGYNHLLARRCIAYRQGTVFADKDDYVETVMKEYVDENAGPGANEASRIRDGVFAYFYVDAVSSVAYLTPEWEGERSFKNLLEVLQELSQYSLYSVPDYHAMDFKVENSGSGTFTFKTYLDQLGTDRTSDTDNAVIFAVGLGNLQNVEYDLDRSAEANAAIVLGSGEKSTRNVTYRENATGADDSPWNDIEKVGASILNEFASQLERYGDSMLQESKYKESYTGEVMQTESTLYGQHYFLGDMVTLSHEGVESDKKVVEVTVTFNGKDAKEDLSIDFQDIST